MKKVFILTIVIISLVLLSSGCKKKFDITGNWTLSVNWGTGFKAGVVVTFSGDKSSGVILFPTAAGLSGTYRVSDINVDFIIKEGLADIIFTGTSTDDDNMSGTMHESGKTTTGNWIATR